MPSLFWIVILLVVFAGWGGGYWAGPEPIRGNNLLHVILVIVLLFVLFSWLGGGPVVHHRWWR